MSGSRKNMKRNIWLVGPCLMALTALSGFAAEELIEKNFTLETGGELVLDVRGADVTIEPGEGNQVRMRAKIKGSAGFVDNYKLTYDSGPDRLVIRAKQENRFKWWQARSRVTFDLVIPSECRLDVHTSGGDIEAHGIAGDASMKTSGGDVILRAMEGTLDLGTSGGSIRLANCHGDKSLYTSGGNLELRSGRGDVEAKTSGGRIELEGVEGRVRAHTSGGDVSIGLIGPNRGLRAHTSGGDIRVYANENIRGNIFAKSSGGRVSVDFPITIRGRLDNNKIEGKLNGGGPEIHLTTSGGSIKILRSR